MNAKVFVATPLYDGKVHWLYLAGMMQAYGKYGNRLQAAARMGSFLPKLRDLLTADFLNSGAEFMACIDADMGWTETDLSRLLNHDRDFVSGVYPKKELGRNDTMARYTGKTDGDLKEAYYVGGGFIVVKRDAVLKMVETFSETMSYGGDGAEGVDKVCGLWSPFCGMPKAQTYLAEDYSFCARWRMLKGEIWVDPAVQLSHVGEHVYQIKE